MSVARPKVKVPCSLPLPLLAYVQRLCDAVQIEASDLWSPSKSNRAAANPGVPAALVNVKTFVPSTSGLATMVGPVAGFLTIVVVVEVIPVTLLVPVSVIVTEEPELNAPPTRPVPVPLASAPGTPVQKPPGSPGPA